MEIYKWKRGHWVNTVFSIKRPDSCTAIFDPSEFWYPLVAQLPEEDRVCPPPKDVRQKLYVYLKKSYALSPTIYFRGFLL